MSPKDYFFLYEHLCEVDDYNLMKACQNLNQDYPEFLTMLIKLFNAAIQTPKTTKLQLQMNKDNSADLFFQQVMEYEKEPKDEKERNDPERVKGTLLLCLTAV